jgi:hypothetical protein
MFHGVFFSKLRKEPEYAVQFGVFKKEHRLNQESAAVFRINWLPGSVNDIFDLSSNAIYS